MKKKLSLILASIILGTSCTVPVLAENANASTGDNKLVISPNPMATPALFADVEKNSELETALKKLVDAGIVKGYEDGTFRPATTLSRAEFCRMVNQLFKYTEKADYGFYDVQQTDWFYDEVLIAKKQGYIQGFEDATFRGNSKITREQVCTILNRILGLYVLYEVQITDPVSDWALSSVQAVVSNGFMSLEAENTFRATQDITRQEFAYLFVPFCDATNPNPDNGNTPDDGNQGGNQGGNQQGGNTPGGNTPGGNTPGGNTPGGNTPGGDAGDDDDEGGNQGGNTPGGNTPGGGSGDDDDDEGGNQGGNTEPDDPVVPDEPEEPDMTLDDVAIDEMQRLYDDLNSIKTFSHAKEFRPFFNSVKKLMKDIIDESATVLITPEYVEEAYGETMQTIKNDYNALCDDCKGQFNTIVLDRAPNYKAVLVEYFYDIIPDEAFDYL